MTSCAQKMRGSFPMTYVHVVLHMAFHLSIVFQNVCAGYRATKAPSKFSIFDQCLPGYTSINTKKDMASSRSPSNSPRGRRRSRRATEALTPEETDIVLEQYRNELIEKDAAILALEHELQRLQNELQSSTGVVRRQHPLQVCGLP